MVIKMSNLSISVNSLKKLRYNFRKNTQVKGGVKQKLAHLDNLMTLALGYTHGYGNFSALVSKAPYEFSIDLVNPMVLAKYEVEHITCASGLENYLEFYKHLGLAEYDCFEFCKDYLIFKLVYSSWFELTNPTWYQQQITTLFQLSNEYKYSSTIRNNLFKFHPLFGLLSFNIFELFTFDDVGLKDKENQIDKVFDQDIIDKGSPDKYETDNNTETLFFPLLPEIRNGLDFSRISTLFMNELEKAFKERRAFDTRAYCAYMFSCDEQYSIDNFADRSDATMYLAESSLVLKEDYEFNSVLLMPEEVMEHDVMFGNQGKSKKNESFLAERWVANIKQGSGTTRVEQQSWYDAIKRAKKSLREGRYVSSHTAFVEKLKPYLCVNTIH